MALKDEVAKAATTHNPSVTGVATTTTYGTGVETYDGDGTTYYGIKSAHSGDGTASATVVDEHTWATARDISKVYTNTHYHAHPYGNYHTGSYDLRVDLCINGSWTNIYTIADNWNWSEDPITSEQWEQDLSYTGTTGWESVTGVRVTLVCTAYSYEGTRSQDATAYVFETQAYYNVKKSYAGVV
jgi:hypothetical protein